MNKRLTEIRKNQKMTMEQFGNSLGVTKAAISRLEKGERNLTEQMIKAICREFNVNEHWLRTGEGSLTNPLSPPEEVEFLVRELLDYKSRDEKNPYYDMLIDMMKTYQALDPNSQLVIQNYFKNLRNNIVSTNKTKTVEETIDEKVSRYRKELELEARQTAESSAYNEEKRNA